MPVRPRGSFAWNWTPTTNLNNELRFGFNHYDVGFFTNEDFERGYRIVQPLISDSEDNFLPQGRVVKTYDFTLIRKILSRDREGVPMALRAIDV